MPLSPLATNQRGFHGQPNPIPTPLSTRKVSPAPSQETTLSYTLSLIARFKQYPIGAMLGLVGAAAANLAAPALTPDGWMAAPFTLSCVAAGMLIERSAHYLIGWYIDPRIVHLAASREARIRLTKLREYVKAGTISPGDARRISASIARRDVAGGVQARPSRRGKYRKSTEPVPTRKDPSRPAGTDSASPSQS